LRFLISPGCFDDNSPPVAIMGGKFPAQKIQLAFLKNLLDKKQPSGIILLP